MDRDERYGIAPIPIRLAARQDFFIREYPPRADRRISHRHDERRLARFLTDEDTFLHRKISRRCIPYDGYLPQQPRIRSKRNISAYSLEQSDAEG